MGATLGPLDSSPVATTNDLKNGLVLNIDGQLWTVTEFQHVKPGKGGAFVRTTLKNVLSGKVVDRTFNAGTKVETATVDKRAMTYLYKEGADFIFMDGDTYDQVPVPAETVGDAANYLLDNAEVAIAVHDGTPLYIELPTSVELVISHTDPGLQGDRSTGGTKPATLETGAEIQVPLFVTHRREGQGRHPRRPVPRPRQQLTGRRTPTVAARSKARKRALDVLYESDVRGIDALTTLAERVALADPPVNDYTIELVEGVAAHRRSIDEILTEYAEGWTVARMPEVDRAVLRLGVYELLWRSDVPDAVVIDEAVELAKSLSTDESPRFVNGILARVLREGVPTPPTTRTRASNLRPKPEPLGRLWCAAPRIVRRWAGRTISAAQGAGDRARSRR